MRRGRLALALAGAALIVLTQPQTWGLGDRVWVPAAGVSVALVAWLGPAAAAPVFLGHLLAALLGLLFHHGGLTAALLEPPAATLEALAAWEGYRRLARGGRGLADPRSAVLFLLLAAGLAPAVFAGLRLLALAPWPPGWEALLGWWLGHALGVAVAAPALLTAVTPALVRRRLAVPETLALDEVLLRDHVGVERPAWGDWVETGGLAAGAGVLGVLLTLLADRRDPTGWYTWSAPLLVIVWAALRQGVRGGTVVAAAAAGLPLLLLSAADPSLQQVRGNLFAQCAVGLVVSAAVAWLRNQEARYRRVVTHVPVVLYSARVRVPPRPGRAPEAEVTLVSAASVGVLGCPPELLLGGHRGHWLERVHPEDRELVLAALGQLSRQELPVVCEYRLAPREGDAADPGSGFPGPPGNPRKPRFRWVRDTLAPHRDGEGRLGGWEGVVVDITEQRALAEDLRRTGNMFHALVTHLPAGVFFVHGSTGRPLVVNARARQLLGQREDQSAGLDHLTEVYRLRRPDGSPYPLEELPVYQALRRGVTCMRDDIVVHRADGRRVPLVTWAAPVHLSSQTEADAAVWVLEDLSALHAAEAARRDSEGRLRTVVETMGEGLLVQDRRGLIVDCNPAACAIFGAPPERLRGRGLAELSWAYLREDGAPLPADELPPALVLRSGRPVRHVVLGLRADADTPGAGVVRWLQLNSMPLGAAGVVSTFSDVTGHRHGQEVLRASEEKYRGLVESLPLILVQVDRNFRIAYANPAVRTLTGYEWAEVAEPDAWAALVHPDDLEPMRAVMTDALAGRSGRLEMRYRARDGTDRVALLMSQPRRLAGEIIGVTNLFLDLTRERRLEQDLERVQRLELVGRLSSGVAHDFNNLLGVILGLSDLCRHQIDPGHPLQADLERIGEAAARAADLAAQLLSLGKRKPSNGHSAELTRVVRRTLELLRVTLPPAVAVEVDLAQEARVPGDETQLQQVVMNLCLNARDAMPQGGRLRVRTEADAEALPGEAGRWACLTVEDEGQGMTAEVLARIFDPFFSTKERGTGLGLAVVQQIVEGLGGRVRAESEPGRGSRFRVWLPLCAAGAVNGEPDVPTPGWEASANRGTGEPGV